jgi:hypothetical protein
MEDEDLKAYIVIVSEIAFLRDNIILYKKGYRNSLGSLSYLEAINKLAVLRRKQTRTKKEIKQKYEELQRDRL